MTPFRSDPRLVRHPMKARPRIVPVTAVAEMWNRIGGLLSKAGRIAGLDPPAMLAVWIVECGGLPFRRGKPVLRFEPHVFFARWGCRNEDLFDAHFRFGGRNGTEGAKWQNHMARFSEGEDWRRFHGSGGGTCGFPAGRETWGARDGFAVRQLRWAADHGLQSCPCRLWHGA